jgi:hypothetical protein
LKGKKEVDDDLERGERRRGGKKWSLESTITRRVGD